VGIDGTVISAALYDPYGAASEGNPVFGYDGQYMDASTGLVNMRARWYQPGTGNFTSVDPAVETTNEPYEFAGDDPVNESDPTGLCVSTPFGCIGPGPANGISGTLGSIGSGIKSFAIGFAQGVGTDYSYLVQADQWEGKQIAGALCNNGANNGIFASELGCGPSTAQCLAAIAATYEVDLANAKANYARDVAANNEALDAGQISSEEWTSNQLRIMNEFRQAEQYYKRIYESQDQAVNDEPLEGGLGDGE
jgi:RHS repeat-associated protein